MVDNEAMSKVDLIREKLEILEGKLMSRKDIRENMTKLKRLNEEARRMSEKPLSPTSYILVYSELNETRGHIEGTKGIVDAIDGYIHEFIESGKINSIKPTYTPELAAYRYTFGIPTSVFDNVNTLFMYKPLFTIHLYKSINDRPDLEQYVGPSNYGVPNTPKISQVKGQKVLVEPKFEIAILADNEWLYHPFILAGAINHEITHAKINYREYVNGDNPMALHKYTNAAKFANIKNTNTLNNLLKRWSYLCNRDEINARANQIYDELGKIDKKFGLRLSLTDALKNCPTYERMEDEFDKRLEMLKSIAAEPNKEEYEKYLAELVGGKKEDFRIEDMWTKLHNAWIQQEKQFLKVAEYWTYKNRVLKI